ncbi:MAG: DUF3617 family protein [Gammaproteobacteria bacterium]
MSKQKRHGKTLLAIIFTLGGASVWAQTVMQPGGWEMKMTVTATDPKTGESKQVSETTAKMCLSKEFLAKEPYLSAKVDEAKMRQKKAKCTTSDYQRDGDKASWKMACEMDDGSKVAMTLNNAASADKLTIHMRNDVNKGGESGVVEMSSEGKFIGPCTKDMPKP